MIRIQLGFGSQSFPKAEMVASICHNCRISCICLWLMYSIYSSFLFNLGKVHVKSSDIQVGDLIIVDKVKLFLLAQMH